MIRENGGWDTFTMNPYKLFPCKSKMELLVEEERVRRELKTNLNTFQAITTEEERKTRKSNYCKKYNSTLTQEQKDRQNALKSEREKCECGCITSKGNMLKHCNSAKHTRLLSLLNTNVSVEKEAKD